ncbi:YdeI/OmpD-associated family protein [Angustibacter aerolatus]
MRFTTQVLSGGGSATGLPVPDDVVAELGGRRTAVVVTVNGYTYRSTTGVMGGRTLVPLAKEHRDAAGVAAGDDVVVELVVDAAPRTVELPEDLLTALGAEPGLRERFDALAPSARKEAVRQLESAKAEATRQRRLAKVLDQLRG